MSLSFIKNILFYAVHLAFLGFMIMSIYDLHELKTHNNILTKRQEYLRNIQSIAVAVVSIIVGSFIIYKFMYYSPIYLLTHGQGKSSPISHDVVLNTHEKCFIYSSGLFLFVTGISGTVINSKKISDTTK